MEPEQNRPSDEAASSESGITIRLDSFEGPLDLLLHLIKREEVDICDIPIARITEQYLQHVQRMRELNINVAGEWLVMAATLIYIKSRMLLPPDPAAATEEAEDDPRTELVYQLLEHQKFKNAAQMLFTREEVENAVWSNPPEEAVEDAGEIVSATLFDLLKAFHEIVKRFESRTDMQMLHEEVSIEEKLVELRQIMLVHDEVLFSHFFERARSKHHLIVTFLAVLEMVRLSEISLHQRKAFDEIYIRKLRTAGDQAV